LQGSCSGFNDRTTIKRLRNSHQIAPLGSQKERYRGPSWSWASVGNPVHYWKDIPGDNDLGGCRVLDILVDYREQHLTGPIASTKLLVSGPFTPALLLYQSFPDPVNKFIRHHEIWTYAIEIREGQNYLDFYPDYLLSLMGEKWLPPGTAVIMFHVASGVHLVLMDEVFFKLTRSERIAVSATYSLKRGTEGWYLDIKRYVRIGILKTPESDKLYTGNPGCGDNFVIV
jgi:hypothetical protein